MRQTLIFLIFFLLSFVSFSQYIEGRVLDAQTQKPIEGVNVYLEGISRGAVTNEKGDYYIKFPFEIVKNDIIHFSHLTYRELKIPYTPDKKNYSVNLLIDFKKLEEVKISEKRNFQQSISYNKLSSMKNGIHSFGSILKDDTIYVLGGDSSYEENQFKKLLEYDPDNALKKFMNGTARNYKHDSYSGDLQTYDIKSDTWSVLKSKFKKRAYHNLNFYQNKIFVLGGKNISVNGKYEYLDNTIEVIDLKNNTTKIDQTNPHQTVDFASFNYKDYLIVLGGSIKEKKNGFKEYSNTVHVFNFKTGNWYQVATMPIAKEVKGVLINDKIYLLGGFNKKPLMSIETFNLLTEKWEKEGDLFYGISKPALTYKDDVIYIFNDGKIITYNTITKELNEYSIDLFLKGAEMFYSNNKLYILGGFRANNYSLYPSSGLFSIDINEFEKTKIHNSKTL